MNLYVITFTKIINELIIRLQGLIEAKTQVEAAKIDATYAEDHLEKEGYFFEYVSIINTLALKRGDLILL